jgi:hypothetical protein
MRGVGYLASAILQMLRSILVLANIRHQRTRVLMKTRRRQYKLRMLPLQGTGQRLRRRPVQEVLAAAIQHALARRVLILPSVGPHGIEASVEKRKARMMRISPRLARLVEKHRLDGQFPPLLVRVMTIRDRGLAFFEDLRGHLLGQKDGPLRSEMHIPGSLILLEVRQNIRIQIVDRHAMFPHHLCRNGVRLDLVSFDAPARALWNRRR